MSELLCCMAGRRLKKKKRPTTVYGTDPEQETEELKPTERVLKWIPSSILGRRSGSSEIMKLGEELRKVIAASRYQGQDYDTGMASQKAAAFVKEDSSNEKSDQSALALGSILETDIKSSNNVQIHQAMVPPRNGSLRMSSVPNLFQPDDDVTIDYTNPSMLNFSRSTPALATIPNGENEIKSYPIRANSKFRISQLGFSTRGNSPAGSVDNLGSPNPEFRSGQLARESFNTLDYRSYVPNEVFRDISKLVRESMSTISGYSAWSRSATPHETVRAWPPQRSRSTRQGDATQEEVPKEPIPAIPDQFVPRKPSSVYTAHAVTVVDSFSSFPVLEPTTHHEAALSPAPLDTPQRFTTRVQNPRTGSFKWKKASLKIKRGLTRERIEAFEKGLRSHSSVDENHLPNCVGISSPLRETTVPPGTPSPIDPSTFAKVRQSVRSWETEASSSNDGSRRMLIRPRKSLVQLRTQNSRMKIRKHVVKDPNSQQSSRTSTMHKSRSMVLRSSFTKSMSRLRQRLSMSGIVARNPDSGEAQNDSKQEYEGLGSDENLQDSSTEPEMDKLTLNYSIRPLGDMELAQYCGPAILDGPPPVPTRLRSKYASTSGTDTDASSTLVATISPHSQR